MGKKARIVSTILCSNQLSYDRRKKGDADFPRHPKGCQERRGRAGTRRQAADPSLRGPLAENFGP